MKATSTFPGALADLTVGSVMHQGVFSAPPDATVYAVAAIMATRQVHAVALSGSVQPRLFSDLDLVATALTGEARAGVVRSRHEVPTLKSDDALDIGIKAMAAAHAAHAVVQDANHAPIGIVSSFDILAVVAGHDPHAAGLPRPRPAQPAISEHRWSHVTVREAMHTGVVAVPPATPLRDLAATLVDHRVHCAIVSGTKPARSGESLVWTIASDMDILRAVAADRHDATAGEAASTELLIVDAHESLDAAAGQLVVRGVSHAVVVEDDYPVGVLSSLDVAGIIAAHG
jgi:CBS domain-containing protein